MENIVTDAAQTCSQCGWSFDLEALRHNTCKKCKSAILVTSVAYLEKFEKPAIYKYIAQYSAALEADAKDRDALLALGICYLQLGLFEVADDFFNRLIGSHRAYGAGYYYRAICMLKGRRPRCASLDVIREAERLATTSMALDPLNGRYELLLAAIRHDYYVLNGMRVPTPLPEELISEASTKHVDQLEAEQICKLLKMTDNPIIEQILVR